MFVGVFQGRRVKVPIKHARYENTGVFEGGGDVRWRFKGRPSILATEVKRRGWRVESSLGNESKLADRSGSGDDDGVCGEEVVACLALCIPVCMGLLRRDSREERCYHGEDEHSS